MKKNIKKKSKEQIEALKYLKRYKELTKFTDKHIADKLGTTLWEVHRWFSGKHAPSPAYCMIIITLMKP